MTLIVYADETGTHDDADVVALSGLIESREYWKAFNRKWKAVLDNYDAEYFHYREFRKNANTRPGDPYYGWPDEKRRHFMFRLATLVGDSAVPTGGSYPTEYNKKIGINNKPFDATISAFYGSTLTMLNLHWPNYEGRVSFIFDKCNRKEWTGPLVAVHENFKGKDPRIGPISFEDDKDPCHLALQAADLSAIHLRNHSRGYVEASGDIFDIGIIDFIISKNMDVQFRNLPKDKINKLHNEMKADEALQRRNGFTGPYIPLKHFDFEKHGYKG